MMPQRERRIFSTAITAAFAWVLAQPPILPGGAIAAGAPMKEWKALGHFDTREACEKQRTSANSALITNLAEYAPNQGAREQPTMQAAASRCVEARADGDPAPD